MNDSEKNVFSNPLIRGSLIAGMVLLIIAGAFGGQVWISHAASNAGVVSLPNSVPPQVAKAQLSGRHNATSKTANIEMTIGIAFKPNKQNEIDALYHNLYNPHSKQYHHWLSQGTFEALFGPTSSQLAAVNAFLKQYGLRTVPGSTNAIILLAAGTVRQLENAFHTQINDYRSADGTTFFANSTNIQLPANLAGSITGVLGLTNASSVHPLLSARSTQVFQRNRVSPHYGGGPNGTGLTPAQIASIYDANPIYSSLSDQGQGVVLGLFELSSYTRADIHAYEKHFGLPNTRIVDKPFAYGTPDHSGADEVELDIDMQLALAPKVNSILVYNASTSLYPLGAILEYGQIAHGDQANAISTSWGSCESSMLPFVADTESSTFLQMALQGQSMFAASGDSGAYDCIDSAGKGDTSIQVDDPASQPYVTAVGGTSFAGNDPGTNPNPGYLGNERVWNNGCTPKTITSCRKKGNGAGGGGVSHNWPMPEYQTGPGVNESGYSQSGAWCGGKSAGPACREVPDVSLNSDSRSGYSIYCTDPAACSSPGWIGVGGTSAAAPLWSAIAALVDSYAISNGQTTVGFMNPILYSYDTFSNYSSLFHDIPHGKGNNGYYPTGASYDMATGLGSPDIYNLLQQIITGPITGPGGNIWVTGHDTDYHCSADGESCHYLQVALTFVMNGSSLPVLALDHGTEVATAISDAFGSSAPTVDTVDPRSGFASLPLVDVNGNPLYSAIVVASDTTCGGCDNNDAYGATPDSDAINARAADITKFLDAGGGILALAGAENISVFYNFLPVPVTGTTVTPPFTFTSYGLSLGLVEGNDDNCCETHNSFASSSSSAYQIAETDSAGLPETLVAQDVLVAPALRHTPPAKHSGPPPHTPKN